MDSRLWNSKNKFRDIRALIRGQRPYFDKLSFIMVIFDENSLLKERMELKKETTNVI